MSIIPNELTKYSRVGDFVQTEIGNEDFPVKMVGSIIKIEDGMFYIQSGKHVNIITLDDPPEIDLTRHDIII